VDDPYFLFVRERSNWKRKVTMGSMDGIFSKLGAKLVTCSTIKVQLCMGRERRGGGGLTRSVLRKHVVGYVGGGKRNMYNN